MQLKILVYEIVNLVLFKIYFIDQTTTGQALRLIDGW